MAGKKKLKQANINRNTSIEVSHTIKKIKENERKYTIILVIFFMIIIGIVGYNVLTIDNDELYSNIKTASANSPYLSLSSTNITLTNKNIMSEKNGLKSKKYAISIINNTDKVKQYKIYFVSDDKDICTCGNKIFNKKSIRYSIDGDVLSLDDDLFIEGILRKNEKKDIVFSMWISDEFKSNEELHFHGHFIIK